MDRTQSRRRSGCVKPSGAREKPRWSVCGIPETFYNDHGSDFTSHHLEQVPADLHLAVVFSTAGKPRGRGKIERYFATVNQLFLCHEPGYSPPRAAACQASQGHAVLQTGTQDAEALKRLQSLCFTR